MNFEKWLRAFKKNQTIRFFINQGKLIEGIMGAVVTVIIVTVIDTQVLPVVINGSDGGIGETVLPLLQVALLIAAIFAAIGIIYVVAKESFKSGK